MKQTVIYLVEGSAGEYDDYRTWPVCGYLTEPTAQKHVKAANEWSKKHTSWKMRWQERENLKNPYDHSAYGHGQNPGTSYEVVTVPLRKGLPRA